jgi:two-component system cell cycle sensor histidine kinase/response regulator CckA
VIGKTVNEVIPEPSLTMVLGKYRKAVEENTTVRWEETSDYPTGRLTGVVSVVPVFDKKGTCTHLVGSVHDITERKRAEDAVRESERRFDELAEQSRTTTWEVDSQGLFTYVSHVSESVWGYHPDELVGRMHFYDMHPETGREAFKTAVFAVTERKQPFRDVVHAVETKDVRLVWGSTNGVPLLNADGTLKGYRGSCTDITERKRAEEILKASEEKYRALVETTDTGYLITDKEGKVIDANREYVRLTGHSELGEILGRSVIEWTAAHEKQRNAEALARCVKDGFIRDLVIDYVDGSNRVTPVEINAKVTGSGESLRIISLCRDVSDRKRAEEVRLQLQLAQAQKMESIGRLAGGVAHDFNNLLTVINGYAALLSKELAVQDPLRRYALEIGETGKRAASLTSQLLAFSRKRAIMPKAVDVNAVVADAERMLQRLIGEDIELVSSLAPHLELVMADPDQIHQMILNLAVNARDAMPNGGKFEITTAEVELDETAADAHPDAAPGRYVRLTVTDTGTGMTEEVQRKIFEPFFTTKEPGKGTGLGLAMVYGAVRQHDGWIEVKSKLGWGSTFRIHLPCIDAGVALRRFWRRMATEFLKLPVARKRTLSPGGRLVRLICC